MLLGAFFIPAHYFPLTPSINFTLSPVGACESGGLVLVHKQKVVGLSPITVNVLCPWVRHFTIITPLDQVYKWVPAMLGR